MNAHLSRRQLMQSAMLAPLLYGLHTRVGVVNAQPPLEAAFVSWFEQNHPPVREISAEFGETFEVKKRIATAVDPAILTGVPTDVFIGMTPFMEMDALISTGTIEPWDPYLSAGMIETIPDPIRGECTVDGGLLAFPMLFDVVSVGANADVLSAAGVDPETRPASWEEMLTVAATINADGLADYGCIYDPEPWRSLIPMALTFSEDVWREDGVFLWTSDAALEALTILNQMTDINLGSPSNTAVYFLSYHNFHVWYANWWDNPSALRQYPLPGPDGDPGRTVFWDTSAVLVADGGNKPEAASYVETIVTDPRLWEANFGNVGTGMVSGSVAQLPPLSTIWEDIATNQPDLLDPVPWARALWDYGLEYGQTIPPTPLGGDQFQVANRHLQSFLNGTESDPAVALQNAQNAVDEALVEA